MSLPLPINNELSPNIDPSTGLPYEDGSLTQGQIAAAINVASSQALSGLNVTQGTPQNLPPTIDSARATPSTTTAALDEENARNYQLSQQNIQDKQLKDQITNDEIEKSMTTSMRNLRNVNNINA